MKLSFRQCHRLNRQFRLINERAGLDVHSTTRSKGSAFCATLKWFNGSQHSKEPLSFAYVVSWAGFREGNSKILSGVTVFIFSVACTRSIYSNKSRRNSILIFGKNLHCSLFRVGSNTATVEASSLPVYVLRSDSYPISRVWSGPTSMQRFSSNCSGSFTSDSIHAGPMVCNILPVCLSIRKQLPESRHN